MTARRPLIAGNWKMNGLRADGLKLVEGLIAHLREGDQPFDMLVCPPMTLVADVAAASTASTLLVGGQDCHQNEKGAHTGDTSAWMLKDVGATHVIVGHSERRADHAESSEVVKAKAGAAHAAGLTAIICIGETEDERDRGEALAVVSGQLLDSLPDGATPDNTVIAYEPVWAIGTGKTATPDDVAEMHGEIRKKAHEKLGSEANRLRILYGGSVKPANAEELLALTDVDGALVGGASLKVEDFWAIAKAAG
ncbi:Triosephosphate isomerase [Caenispirillum salinarum AK4]|uniref:Triosephosphate isomerase n=1 Tax=Caenispirillum salinarum AK4 TaxID=1238182 RepID=K9GT73_9PROT|nr:triose-phosphate isomerase [Caenispirillum salinarum]EKV28387.1 Triosephosphate isomerase [Caenispirillum salinarum AK4]